MKKLSLLISAFILSIIMYGQVLNEGFEGTFPPTGWTLDTISGNASWVASANNNNSTVSARTGSNMAYFYSGNYNDDQTLLITPSFDISTTASPELRFFHTQVDWSGDQDSLRVFYKTSATGTWTLLASYTNAQLSWIERVLPLPAPSNDYYIAFEGTSGYGRGVTIDDVTVGAAPSCLAPMANSSTYSLTSNSAGVSWIENGTATSWRVEWDTAGYAAGTARNSMVVVSDTFLLITGLTAETDYDWKVKALCSPTDSSVFSNSSFFTGYCAVGSSSGDYISSITSVGASQNISYTASSQPSGAYSNETSQLFSSFQGATFDINTNYVGGNNGVNIWVDWNNDLDFDDAGEIIGNSSGASAHTISVTMPAMAPVGTYRMRIRAQWGVTSPPSCGIVNYGSTVDFELNLTAPPACLTPSPAAETGLSATSATLNWVENGFATQWEIEWDTAGFTLGTGNSVIVNTDTFTTLMALSAQSTYNWYVRAICGSNDTSGWTSVSTFNTPCAPILAPFTESFDNTTLPNCWSRYQVTGSGWVFGTPGFSWNNSGCPSSTPADHTGNSGNYAALDFSVPDAGVVLELPTIDVSALNIPMLSFYFQMCGQGYSPLNVLFIEAYDGTNWNIVNTIQQGTTGWELFEFVVSSAIINTNQVKLRFRAEDGGGVQYYGDMAIDDVSIIEAPSCPDPTNLSALIASSTSADLSWTENGSATTWRVEYGAPGFTPGTGTQTGLVGNPFTLTGLNTNNSYDYYVRSICGASDSSQLVGPFTFTVGMPLSGIYTIDSSMSTNGTNFQNFTDFTSVINHFGVAGQVTVNVVAGSGPYNEQVIFNTIPGVSATNSVTINGNNNTINYEAVSGDYRQLGFDGSEYITVRNLNITSLSTTYGYGVHFTNGASNIFIDSCNFDLSSITSTSSTNSGGAISSSSVTSTTGGAGSNYITIANSTFDGGSGAGMYYGMRFNGASAAAMDSNIRIINNQISNFYVYGIALDDVSASYIEGNDVNRAGKISVSSFYGLYTTGGCERDTINANAFHDSHTSASSLTGLSYVIYNSANDAPASGPNIFVNNLIYNINSNGTTYAIYNSGSDYQYYVHNTVSLDDPNATGGTTRGVYQTTAATGVLVQNNIISITKGGSGVKHGLYFNTSTSSIISDYNDIYVNSSGTGAQYYGYTGGNKSSLADWQASSYGLNSLDVDPLFVSNVSDLTPGNPLINNMGTNLGVPIDFYGVARTATPDLGAIEFVPPACIQPSMASASAIGTDSAIVSWVEGGSATKWEVQYGITGFTLGSGISTIVNVDTFMIINGLTSNTSYDFYVRAICGSSDSSAWTSATTFSTLFQTCGPSSATTLPFIEGWENLNDTATGPANIICNPDYTWYILSNDPNGRARYGTAAVLASSGSGAITLDAITSSAVIANDLILTLDIAAYSSATDLELLFDYANHGEEDHANDSVWIRGSQSDSWVGVYDLYANRPSTGAYASVGPIDIDAALTAAGQTVSSTFQVRFGQEDNFPATSPTASDGFSFDNISVRQTPLCLTPTTLFTSVITATSADFSWTDPNASAAPNYQYSYGPVGFIAGQGTQMVVASDSVTVSGLAAATTYDWYVRSLCGGTDTSAWSSVSTFTTSCATFTAPYTQTFDGNTTPICWSQSAVLDGPWVFGGPGFSWNTLGCSFVPTDHTGNSGSFAALDFSGSGVTDVVLEMPVVDVSTLTNPYLEFYFVMCGTGYTPINKLYVEAFNGTSFVAIDSIQQGTNGWKSFGYDLTNFKYNTNDVKVRFRASSGSNTVTMYLGDQAIDDVSIKEAPADNLAVTAVVNPNSGCGLSATSTVEMTIANLGTVAQSNFSVGYAVNGVSITPETYTGTIAPNTSANYTFTTPANLSAGGTYVIDAYTSLANDYDMSNDTMTKTVISLTSVSTFPYSESFETNAGGWIAGGVNSSWALGTPTGSLIDTASNGTQAWVTNLTGNYGASEFAYVNSPCFDFTSVANPYLELDIFYDIEFQWDGALIQASSDQGVTWSTVGAQGDTVNWYNDTADAVAAVDPTGQSWTGDATLGSQGWITAKHAIDGMGGLPSVQIRVLFISDGSVFAEGFAFDNVKIYDKAPPVATLPYYPIGTINTVDPITGVADSIGVNCWTSGTVAGVDLDGNAGLSFTIIDQVGSSPQGINIFNFNDVSNYVVNEGDSIMVRGGILQFNGLTELSPDSIRIIATGRSLPPHQLVTSLSEATESQLIEVRDFVVITPSGSGSYNMTATNGTDTITIRVDADTDVNDSLSVAGRALIAGDTICSLKGIGGQFDSSNPYTSGYQIFPMRFSDIDTTSCLTITGIVQKDETGSTINFYPNPNKGQFKLSISGVNANHSTLDIVNINGQIVHSENLIINGSLSKDISINVEKGVYFVRLINENGVKVEKLIVE